MYSFFLDMVVGVIIINTCSFCRIVNENLLILTHLHWCGDRNVDLCWVAPVMWSLEFSAAEICFDCSCLFKGAISHCLDHTALLLQACAGTAERRSVRSTDTILIPSQRSAHVTCACFYCSFWREYKSGFIQFHKQMLSLTEWPLAGAPAPF